MAESNFTTPEQKNAADRSSGSASEKLEPSLNTLQGETAQMQAEPTIPVREEASAAPKGFGAVLRAAREAEGISVGDMAVQCRLAVTQIRALEEERLENLPEPVYVRAFIRGYAHALKIDPAPLVDDYMMRCGRRGAAVEVGQLPNRSPSREAVFHEPPKNRTLKAVLFVVLAAFVGGGIWAVYSLPVCTPRAKRRRLSPVPTRLKRLRHRPLSRQKALLRLRMLLLRLSLLSRQLPPQRKLSLLLLRQLSRHRRPRRLLLRRPRQPRRRNRRPLLPLSRPLPHRCSTRWNSVWELGPAGFRLSHPMAAM